MQPKGRNFFLVTAAAAAAAALLASGIASAAPAAPSVAGSWRIYSARIDYDRGGFASQPLSSRQLKLSGRTWQYGSSRGSFTVTLITPADWRRWGVSSYGPKWKIVLKGWNGSKGEGPIEQSGARVDFVWVLYRVKPPLVTWPGMVSLKFGRVSL